MNQMKVTLVSTLLLFSMYTSAQNVLLFVSHEQTYYSEYIVMKQALEAAGYTVDVRSSVSTPTSIYMIAQGGSPTPTIDGVANALSGSSYAQFITQFENSFGAPWDPAYNATPASIAVDGSLEEVDNMDAYDALVVVGGTGAIDYRVDGSYFSQGSASEIDVQLTAERLNALAIDALQSGKPVMAQCHGASLAAFWRVPGTSGPGAESIGYSLLREGNSTGFPEPATAPMLSNFSITYRENERVTVSSPHGSLPDADHGQHRLLTTRDWYPQTVAYAARSLINIIETYPAVDEMNASVAVIILHGGSVDVGSCGAGNRNNDVPCNYGGGANIPADYLDVQNLLNANSSNDDYMFTVSDLNLTGALPFDANDQSAIESYLADFDAVFFYKHWSTGVTAALENAIVSFADNGGGVVALHHGLYNDIDGPRNKDILVNQLFGVQSAMATWSANLTNYTLYSTNHGHFVSTFGIPPTMNPQMAPATWGANPLLAPANASFSYYTTFQIYDEIYNNMAFIPGAVFGRGVNEVNPLFSNNQTPSAQVHTSGFVKLFNPTADESIGRVVYLEPGERKESTNINHTYGQIVRNAVYWAAPKDNVVLGIELNHFSARPSHDKIIIEWATVFEENNDYFTVEKSRDGYTWKTLGEVQGAGNSNKPLKYTIEDHHPTQGVSYYRLKQTDFDGKFTYSKTEAVDYSLGSTFSAYPNPFNKEIHIMGEHITRLMIRDMNGSVRYTADHIETVDTSFLPCGMYILQVWQSGKLYTRSVVKM